MPPTPVDEHTQEYEELAGLSALRVLEGDELIRFQRHALGCAHCKMMVRLDREALARVSLVTPEMEPSPDFKQRLMRRAVEELEQSPTSAQAATGKLLPFWRRSPYLSALAAVLVLGVVTAGGYSYENQTVATYALSGSASGTARVIIRRSGAAELEMRSAPDPDPGWVYEAWLIPPGQRPVAVGTAASGEANVPLPADLRGSTIAITRERGRVDAPTSEPLMSTVVQG